MDYLSLFSGACGGDLAMQHLLGFRCLGYVEIENYCQKVVRQRIEDGLLDPAPIFGDIRKFISEGYAESYKGMVDVITGGFPCQDISVANAGGYGITGESSKLWFSMADTIRIIRPEWVFVENSPGLLVRGLESMLSDLAQTGYDARWHCISASSLGAFHKRERFWLVAHSHSIGLQRGNKDKIRLQWWRQDFGVKALVSNIPFPEVSDPHAFGSNDGLAHRVERTRAIGNGQVPIVAATAWRILSGE